MRARFMPRSARAGGGGRTVAASSRGGARRRRRQARLSLSLRIQMVRRREEGALTACARSLQWFITRVAASSLSRHAFCVLSILHSCVRSGKVACQVLTARPLQLLLWQRHRPRDAGGRAQGQQPAAARRRAHVRVYTACRGAAARSAARRLAAACWLPRRSLPAPSVCTPLLPHALSAAW